MYAIGVDFPIEVDPSRVLRRIYLALQGSLSISGPGCCTILDFGSEQSFFFFPCSDLSMEGFMFVHSCFVSSFVLLVLFS